MPREPSSALGDATTTNSGHTARSATGLQPNSQPRIANEVPDRHQRRKSANLSTRTLLTPPRHYYGGQVINGLIPPRRISTMRQRLFGCQAMTQAADSNRRE